MILPTFKYSYLSGPLLQNELNTEIKQGNCRLAVQLYFYLNHDKYFKPKEILNPEGYKYTGKFVFKPENQIRFNEINKGDVIYAERQLNKKGEKLNRDKSTFKTEDDWILFFHTAIYLGNNKVYHATTFEENSCVWDIDKFKTYYKITAIKRFI